MPATQVSMPAVTIPINGSTSNTITNLDDSIAFAIYSPDTLTSTQAKIEVEPTTTGTAFVTLQSGGSDVVIAAGKCIVINPIPFRQLRITSTSVEAAARTFSVIRTMPV